MTVRSLCARVVAMFLMAVGVWMCPPVAEAAGDVTPLYMGVPESISGEARSSTYFSITVPAGTSGLRVRTFNGTGDLDLFVSRDVLPARSSTECPYSGGATSYTCDVAPAVAATYYILVYSSGGYANVMLEASPLTITPLSVNTPLTISGASGSSTFYSITVPSGATNLQISTGGGSGDVDLHVTRGTLPSRNSAKCSGTSGSNAESCVWTSPQPGTYYILAYGFSTYAGTTLQAGEASVTPLTMDAPVTISGAANSSALYSITVPAGTTSLRVMTSGGTGSVSLAARRGAIPDASSDSCPHFGAGTRSCAWLAPPAGTYFFRVTGLTTYSSVQLMAGPVPVTPLTWNAPTTVSGTAGMPLYYAVTVPAGTPMLQVRTAGGTGNVDLYLGNEEFPSTSTSLCSSSRESTSESCVIGSPVPGTYHILLNTSSSFADVQLTAGPPDITQLALPAGTAPPFSGARDSQTYFSVTVPPGTSTLRISMSGGTGDADLYVLRDQLPTRGSAECSRAGGTNDESCIWLGPSAGTYFILVYGFSAFANAQLQAEVLTFTPVTMGAPLTVNGATGSSRYLSLTVPAGTASLQITTSGGTGNVNLFVNRDALPTTTDFLCSGVRAATAESCAWIAPRPGTYYILLQGQGAYANVQLQANPLTVTALTLGVPLTISGAADSVNYYALTAPLGTPGLEVVTSGGTGNPDIQGQRDQLPTSWYSGCFSSGATSEETCRWTGAALGTYYIIVTGQTAYADVQLLATSYETPRYSLSTSSWTAPGDGGSRIISLTASPASAAWETTSSASWLTVSPSSGTGSAVVTLTAAASEGTSSRSAVVSIAGRTLFVTQQAPIEVSGGSRYWTVDASGTATSIGITAFRSGATWTASSAASWVSVSPASGSGSGTVTVTVAPNASSAQTRRASVTVAGATITISQTGVSASYSLSLLHWQPSAGGGTRTVQVTSVPADASWQSIIDADWIQSFPSSSGRLTLSAAPNQTGARRTATVTIGDRSLLVTQLPVDVPSGLTVASVVGNTVTLHWQWSGPPPDSYVVKGGFTANQTIGTLPTGSAAPSFTFDGPTGTFFVRVAAVRNGRELSASENVRVVIGTPEVPAAPANLLGLVSGSGLALSWRNPMSGGTPTSLMLDVTGAVTTSVPVALGDQFAVPSVPPGIYEFRLRALNATGTSVTSNAVRLQVPQACRPFDVPDVPNGLQVSRVGNVVTARWNPPVRRGAVRDYVLVISGAANMTLPMTSREISSPAPPGTYTFTVAARNACGTGVFFDPQSITVP